MVAPGFIFGGETGETPQTIKRKRQIANMLIGRNSAPRNVGEGIAALGDGLVAGVLNSRAKRGEAAGQKSASTAFAPILSALSGGEAPAYTGPNAPVDVPNSASAAPSGDVAGGILETAKALGVDPVDLGTAISYETAGTFDPTKRGPTTQWGQHQGLIQFGEPQAKKYGVDWNNPIGSQLGADGAVAKYLKDTGVKPGMGLLDIYSAINAGGVGRYNRSDANNGGAPGTVADKVREQMAGHRRKASELLSAYSPQPTPQGGGVQVASLDPAAGVQQAVANQPPIQSGIDTGRIAPVQQERERIVGQEVPQQVAQADLSTPGAGIPDARPQAAPQQGQPSMAQLYQALQNPFLNEGQRSVVQNLIQQQTQANDPMRQLQMQNIQSQIDTRAAKADNPATFSKTPVYGTDKDGKTVLGTIGDDGSFKKIDTGGFDVANGFEKIDTGTEIILRDKRTGQVANVTPKNNFEEALQKGEGRATGKAKGEAQEAFDSLRSKMPGLQKVVSELDVLADQATYTYGGQAVDGLSRQLGLGATEGGLARTKYIATVDNQVLPLLRDTFGAAFTVKEGESLRATLGDPNKAPSEKQAVLKSFIQQKQRDLEALARRTGGEAPAPQGGGADPLGIRN